MKDRVPSRLGSGNLSQRMERVTIRRDKKSTYKALRWFYFTTSDTILSACLKADGCIDKMQWGVKAIGHFLWASGMYYGGKICFGGLHYGNSLSLLMEFREKIT